MDNIKQVNLTTDDLVGAAQDDWLNAAIGNPTAAAPGWLFGAKLDVLMAGMAINRNSAAGDETPATYDGHAKQALTWTAAKRDDTNESYIVGGRLTFVPTGSATIGTQTLHGVALYDSTGAVLLGAKNFDAPITVTVGSPVLIDLTLQPAKKS